MRAMSDVLVWTQDGPQGVDTIHRAGCSHTRMSNNRVPLDAADVDEAKRQIAEDMGWDDYPDDGEGCGFEIRVAPCAR